MTVETARQGMMETLRRVIYNNLPEDATEQDWDAWAYHQVKASLDRLILEVSAEQPCYHPHICSEELGCDFCDGTCHECVTCKARRELEAVKT